MPAMRRGHPTGGAAMKIDLDDLMLGFFSMLIVNALCVPVGGIGLYGLISGVLLNTLLFPVFK